MLAEFETHADKGIQSASVAERQGKHGKNQYDEQKSEGIGKKILHNLRDVTTIILLLAAVLSFFMGIYHDEGFIEFFVIMGIVALNMVLAISQERSAEKSLAALQNLNSPHSLVVRDGIQKEIDSADLLPGDILLLRAGDMISADARLLESTDLAVDESALTGESMPSEKDAGAELSGKVAIADQSNMVFSGCLVTAGRARALVAAIGMDTQMGLIAGYLNNAQKLKTPLQTRIDKIGKVISAVAIASAIVMFALGFLRGADAVDMIFVAVSLAVAAVPETLALIVTLSLSHGVTEMVKKNALIRKLPAVETLGGTSIICTDKTGTLTQNRMTVRRLWREGGDAFDAGDAFTQEQMDFAHKFALVVNASAETQPDGTVNVTGSPTEAAIVRLLLSHKGDKGQWEKRYPRAAAIAFSSERKMSTTIHRDPAGGYLVLTCGAYDRVPFQQVSRERQGKRDAVHDTFAHESYRIFALGSRHIDVFPEKDRLGDVEAQLTFEGIVGIIDPPRPECAGAIATARNAGIRTVMITGDHAVTAGAIARQIGLMPEGGRVLTGLELSAMGDEELIENVAQYSVYARVSPEDKIRIVEAWQE
ncbi:MAG: HAD-IC family P-type ATPase, partial [Oscillospiraceae bacterium]|nr:HAD-IC family P-type ATPase [Oscillospiraceae bacterium]